jgi:hypothetical protein
MVEVTGGDVDRGRLSESQKAGGSGSLSQAMGAFLQWIAGQYEGIQTSHRTRTLELRNDGYVGNAHTRLPAALAELQSGWEIWLKFAPDRDDRNSGTRVDARLAERRYKCFES